MIGRCASRRSAALRAEPTLRLSQAKPAAAIAVCGTDLALLLMLAYLLGWWGGAQ